MWEGSLAVGHVDPDAENGDYDDDNDDDNDDDTALRNYKSQTR